MSSINRTFLLTLLQLAFVWLALSLNIFPFDLSHGWMVIHPCIYFSLYGLRGQQSKQGHPYFPLLGCILQGFPLFHSGTADCCLLIQNTHSCLLISWNFFFSFFVVLGVFFIILSWVKLLTVSGEKNLLFLHEITLVVSHQTISWNST